MGHLYYQMGILFSLSALGFAANKLNIMDEASNNHFSKLIVNITIPALIISSSLNSMEAGIVQVLNVLGVAALMFIVTSILSRYLVKWLRMERTVELMLNYSNLGFMGMPIVTGIYGETGVFYVSLFMMIFNISLFTHGIRIFNSNKNSQLSLKQSLNAGSISAFIAMILFFLKIPIPGMISDLLQMVGSITPPLAMIIIGSTLAQIRLKEFYDIRKLSIFVLLKMVLYPVLVYAILTMIIRDPMIVNIATILWALPSAGNVSMVCTEYEGNTELVTKGIFLTTIASVITLPCLINFLL
ncbi:AEC family transporter [Lacrimispora aerotolerans]|uniref:AEC family transporter n=1 Tax=Lacrimispora aerotolerans TaxID=36832 RepID=UPI00047B31BA|nr:AEC family transporter [Lacrimispora aerotolerans]